MYKEHIRAITKWARGKGLDFITDKILETVLNQILGLKDVQDIFQKELNEINGKLNLILEAPYNEAIMYLREGNLKLCKERVITAITYNPLDLPALCLYIQLLRLEGNYILALDYYFELMDTFGLREDIIPKILIDIYEQHATRRKISLQGNKIEVNPGDNSYAQEVWCFQSGFSVTWKLKSNVFLWFTQENDMVNAYNWRGEEIFRAKPNSTLELDFCRFP